MAATVSSGEAVAFGLGFNVKQHCLMIPLYNLI